MSVRLWWSRRRVNRHLRRKVAEQRRIDRARAHLYLHWCPDCRQPLGPYHDCRKAA